LAGTSRPLPLWLVAVGSIYYPIWYGEGEGRGPGLMYGKIIQESNMLPHVAPAEWGPIIPAYYLNIHMKHFGFQLWAFNLPASSGYSKGTSTQHPVLHRNITASNSKALFWFFLEGNRNLTLREYYASASYRPLSNFADGGAINYIMYMYCRLCNLYITVSYVTFRDPSVDPAFSSKITDYSYRPTSSTCFILNS
jgi:hypothetical protein